MGLAGARRPSPGFGDVHAVQALMRPLRALPAVAERERGQAPELAWQTRRARKAAVAQGWHAEPHTHAAARLRTRPGMGRALLPSTGTPRPAGPALGPGHPIALRRSRPGTDVRCARSMQGRWKANVDQTRKKSFVRVIRAFTDPLHLIQNVSLCDCSQKEAHV